MRELERSVLALLACAACTLSGCSATIDGAHLGGDAAVALDATPDAPDDALDVEDTALPDIPREATGQPEDCDTPFDDDGDGRVNEDCVCPTVGEGRPCFELPASRFGEHCRFGAQVCEPSGAWGPCRGSWLPLPGAGGACAIVEEFTDLRGGRAPVDVIWFVDTSGSMSREAAAVNANLNRFAGTIASSGLDFRVVMVARRGTGTLQICVPPPLGGASCGDAERFRHVNRTVNSTDGLAQLIMTRPLWQDFVRREAAKVFVAVTDDESRLSADEFDRTVRMWPGFDSYVFDSIVGFETSRDCPTMARRGGVYLELTARTMGDRARVCDSDWSGIFATFARGITTRVTAWTLRADPLIATLQIWATPPGGTATRVLSGWTYDPATRRLSIDPDVLAVGSRVRVVYRPR